MFQTLVTQPLYNGFIWLVSVVPAGEVGFAIIVLTGIIRLLFYPVFASQIKTTMGMQAMQPELQELQVKYKDDKERQVREMGALYKKYNVNPLSLFLSLFIQIPILLGLYYAFFHTPLPTINSALLYPFVHEPSSVNVNFLGILDLAQPHNILIVIVVALLQFVSIRISLARTKNAPTHHLSPEKLAAMKMQQNITLYMLPAIMAMVTYSTPAAVGLYFAASSAFAIAQEFFIRRQLNSKTLKRPK
jgi:YidC/Oxa1 family membrane protein insertase